MLLPPMEADIDHGMVLPLLEPSSPTAAGTNDCAEASDADDDDQSLPAGPRSFEELVNSTEFALPRLLSHVASISGKNPLEYLNNLTVVVTTSYSGIGTIEWCMQIIQHALASLGCTLHLVLWSATDYASRCRNFLMKHRHPPRHIFGDLLERLPAGILERLTELQARFRAQLPGHAAGKKKRVQAARTLGEEFLKEACEVLEELFKFDARMTAWCFKCNKYCKVVPDIPANGIWLEAGGNTCTPWSTSGSMMGWLDPMSLPALAWGWWMRHAAPHGILNECVVGWPAAAFFNHMLAGLKFTMETVRQNPLSQGIPVTRPRSYTLVALGMAEQLVPLNAAHQASTSRTLVLDGSVFLRAPAGTQYSYKKARLEKRHINLDREAILRLPWSSLLPFGARCRLMEHRKSISKESPGPFFGIVSQTMKFAGPVRPTLPCLQRNTLCVRVPDGRIVMPVEHFLAQGVPIFCDAVPPELRALPDEEFLALGPSEARQMAGNMMHFASASSSLQLLLFCFRFDRQPGTVVD
jgi:hypothetical protein